MKNATFRGSSWGEPNGLQTIKNVYIYINFTGIVAAAAAALRKHAFLNEVCVVQTLCYAYAMFNLLHFNFDSAT